MEMDGGAPCQWGCCGSFPFHSHMCAVGTACIVCICGQDQAEFELASVSDSLGINAIVQFIKQRLPGTTSPDIGIICGSGLGNLHEMLTDKLSIPYSAIPGFPLSTVEGHSGELVRFIVSRWVLLRYCFAVAVAVAVTVRWR